MKNTKGEERKMKSIRVTLVPAIITLFMTGICLAQDNIMMPDLVKLANEENWEISNREVTLVEDGEDATVFFNAQPGDGIAWLEGFEFTNGTIEVDIKGKDIPGSSFVGIAFRGVDDNTYDAVYFRPFNFHAQDPVRRGHAVQYISHPTYTWFKLREEHPEEYENPVNSIADPDAFFHAKLVIEKRTVEVFVNNSDTPYLVVDELSDRTGGWIGLWVGNNSDGTFSRLRIIHQNE